MRHLWKNMKKHYNHPLFSQNMWPATKCFTIEKYNYHMGKIEEKTPYALAWLDDNHPFVWTRSKFSEEKVVPCVILSDTEVSSEEDDIRLQRRVR
jgi:hypothetical protein